VHAKETAERFRRMSQTEDCKEGVRSFIEKRPPVWKGR
jgi:enoyl-CoA hydratase/carnithine racemase